MALDMPTVGTTGFLVFVLVGPFRLGNLARKSREPTPEWPAKPVYPGSTT